MRAGTLISVGEYLHSSYHPDREFIDGSILERCLGERDHSELQGEFIVYLARLRRKLGIHAYPEQRVQVSATRFRVPDVCIVVGLKPTEQIFTKPPFVCIEILSKDDRLSEMQQRIDDYLRFGVPYCWVVDPREHRAWVYTSEGCREVADGLLRTENPEIVVPLAEVFDPSTE
jgi:Uma2 family endonuclease